MYTYMCNVRVRTFAYTQIHILIEYFGHIGGYTCSQELATADSTTCLVRLLQGERMGKEDGDGGAR